MTKPPTPQAAAPQAGEPRTAEEEAREIVEGWYDIERTPPWRAICEVGTTPRKRLADRIAARLTAKDAEIADLKRTITENSEGYEADIRAARARAEKAEARLAATEEDKRNWKAAAEELAAEIATLKGDPK